MKKTVLVPLLLVTLVGIIFALTSCDFNAPLRKHMVSYYSDDNNYQSLEGIITDLGDGHLIEIEILTESPDFYRIANSDCQKFYLINYPDFIDKLSVGDKISFVSAPMCFYNGDQYRIVSLEKDGEVYLTYEEGKVANLEWIETMFG